MKTRLPIAIFCTATLLSSGCGSLVCTTLCPVSVTVDGTLANNDSSSAMISADGRYVVFESSATNLVDGITNSDPDIFLKDMVTGTIQRVSVSSGGSQGDGRSESPAMSADGRYIAYSSSSTNLVDGDTNAKRDIFEVDTHTNSISKLTQSSDGGATDDHSYNPNYSDDGRYLSFYSAATNLVSGDSNGVADVFVYDRQSGTTEKVSVTHDQLEGDALSLAGPAEMSSDGRYVVFQSNATNLVTGDTNGVTDVFLRDRTDGTTSRVSIASDGTEGNGISNNPDISADGLYVAFQSAATNLVTGDTNGVTDVFVYDTQNQSTERVSIGSNGAGASSSSSPSISDDGRYVAFNTASPLVSSDSNGVMDIYVRDRSNGSTFRIGLSAEGSEGDARSADARFTPGSTLMVFISGASNFISGDTGGLEDAFVMPFLQSSALQIRSVFR